VVPGSNPGRRLLFACPGDLLPLLLNELSTFKEVVLVCSNETDVDDKNFNFSR